MDNVKKYLKTVIANQDKIINEVLEIKTRVVIVEQKMNEKVDYELIIKNIKDQKNDLQEKLMMIEKSIGLLDEKLQSMKKEVEDTETAKYVDKVNNSKQCEYDRNGFCKMRERCVNLHASEICDDYVVVGVCSKPICVKRHPKLCFNFIQTQCRWGELCKYLHREQMIKIITQYEIERKKVKNDKNHDACATIIDHEDSNENLESATISEMDENNEVVVDEDEEKSIEFFMAKAKAFDDPDDEFDNETIETIMAKASMNGQQWHNC